MSQRKLKIVGGKPWAKWSIGQGLTVSDLEMIKLSGLKGHITVHSTDKIGKDTAVKAFHFSIKYKNKIDLSGATQPGCTWEWNVKEEKYVFKGWHNLSVLNLTDADKKTLAANITKIVVKTGGERFITGTASDGIEPASVPS